MGKVNGVLSAYKYLSFVFQPLEITKPSGEKLSVIFLDTEGILLVCSVVV